MALSLRVKKAFNCNIFAVHLVPNSPVRSINIESESRMGDLMIKYHAEILGKSVQK